MEATIETPIDLKNIKVCIAYPSPDTVHTDFMNDVIQLITNSGQFVRLGITTSNSSRIAVNRNILVANARLIGDCTHILFVDSDTKFPIPGLMQLLMHDKDIVCATTCKRKGNDRSAIGRAKDYSSIKPDQQLVQMIEIGMPFMLVKLSVFDKIDKDGLAPNNVYFADCPRWMMRQIGWNVEGDEALMAEDHYFCYLAQKAGYEIWCDMELSMGIGHLGLDCFYIKNPEQIAHEAKVDEIL